MKNYYRYWADRYVRDGLRFIKLIIGLGLTIIFAYEINLIAGALFFGWNLVEALIEKK